MGYSDLLGSVDDAVTILLDGEPIGTVKSYSVRMGIITQPASFDMVVGMSSSVKEIRKRFPIRTPFELQINGATQMSGLIDGITPAASGETTVAIKGRDVLAPLHDTRAVADLSFGAVTYRELTERILSLVGYENYALEFTNRANRQAVASTTIAETGPPRDTRTMAIFVAAGASTTAASIAASAAAGVVSSIPTVKYKTVVPNPLLLKFGEKPYELLRRELDRAGLFFWAAGSGYFVLSEPNAKQVPTYLIRRQRGQTRNEVNVETFTYQDDVTGRFAEYIIEGRTGGKKKGKSRVRGSYVDDEMVGYGFGTSTSPPGVVQKIFAARDEKAVSDEQARYLARKRAAEQRNAGWKLIYEVPGHTTTVLGSSGKRAIWTIDTMVEVQDEELGVSGVYYIESLEHSRSTKTTTRLNLMRPEDLIFAENLF